MAIFFPQNPQDFWDAINFWIFFAVGHPLLQPILWISDVLHGSPGELVGGLVPVSFLAANILFIGATALSKEVRYFALALRQIEPYV
jgi:hypothetical protein